MSIFIRLGKLISQLEELSKINLIGNWHQDLREEVVPIGEKDSLIFKQSDAVIHLTQTWRVPKYFNNLDITGTTIRLKLIWWASLVEIFINGAKVQEGDLFDQKCRLLLAENVQEDQNFKLEIRLISPKHDRGALQKSELVISYPHQPCDPYKLSEELGVISAYLPLLTEYELELDQIVSELELIFSSVINNQIFNQLANIRRSLVKLLSKFFQDRKIYILGNAHIDVAWLWAIAETKEVINRTFNSVIDLQKHYPELIFNQTTALFYEWIEQEYPELFIQIQDHVRKNQWELTGGMWVEPDCNLPSGESLIRQIIYGKQYFLDKFNQDVKIAFLPDTFGFNFQLPQILLKSGFAAFITQKLTWNDTNKFPHQVFWWQGLDGSKIFTYFCNELGLGIEPVAIANYATNIEAKHHIKDHLWLYGVGDHGGGPTADMLNLGREWSESELFYKLIPTKFSDFIEQLKQSNPDIPTWHDELYLEFHRGTYTSKSDQKLQCRQSEILLGNLEKYLAIATLVKNKKYPKLKLDQAWKGLLLNQFHDILPGTSIHEVFIDANQTWGQVNNISNEFFNISKVVNQNDDLYIWNFCNWVRSEIIEIKIDSSDNYLIQQHNNLDLLLTQKTKNGLIFNCNDIEGLGSSQFRLVKDDGSSQTINPDLVITNSTIENKYIKVDLDIKTGEISQIYDKRFNNNLLSNNCELEFFEDKGQYWDAWNIDPNYEDKKLSGLKFEAISIYESGNLRVSWQIIKKFQNSTFIQEIQLDAFNPYITIRNWVDWQEEHILVKATIPLSFSSDFATYHIPMGAIARSTKDKTKFEVPAHFWGDISTDGVGLSLLNNCKYGYDAKHNQIRLSLLRSPNFPCPNSDRGVHEFIYRLVPHQGNIQAAKIHQLGYELNNPLVIQNNSFHISSFIKNTSSNIILSAFKQSDLRSKIGLNWIVRFYESCGETVNESITFAKSIQSVCECDLLEHPLSEISHNQAQFSCTFTPFEIKTFAITFNEINH
ncbi:alpha-mannosidase [Synechococcus sp. PCC 7502]|uniref:alpha-mannosidase n=1 Tax=Synechococcus sp. PCC 7502 TaxID=1173263 RepID=UPI00029FF8A3|nr:glycoside hydrolase family 38 C-terminal domain-containing protein [Synechococcus sp. PCC 7502]AFY74003.1 alpha-mannosidase [Synechococcus sp. PCC 7502]